VRRWLRGVCGDEGLLGRVTEPCQLENWGEPDVLRGVGKDGKNGDSGGRDRDIGRDRARGMMRWERLKEK
jgi:hypothetical protein